MGWVWFGGVGKAQEAAGGVSRCQRVEKYLRVLLRSPPCLDSLETRMNVPPRVRRHLCPSMRPRKPLEDVDDLTGSTLRMGRRNAFMTACPSGVPQSTSFVVLTYLWPACSIRGGAPIGRGRNTTTTTRGGRFFDAIPFQASSAKPSVCFVGMHRGRGWGRRGGCGMVWLAGRTIVSASRALSGRATPMQREEAMVKRLP